MLLGIQVANSRLAYNGIINNGHKEEMLLNLVRLRYDDPISFVKVYSLNAKYELKTSPTITTNLKFSPFKVSGGDVEIGGSYSENPTISFVPVDGEDYANLFLTPLNAKTLMLLYYLGWDIESIFMLSSKQIHNYANAPDREYDNTSFLTVVHLLKELHQKRLLSLYTESSSDDKDQDPRVHLLLGATDNSEDQAKILQFQELLDLDPSKEEYKIVTDLPTTQENEILTFSRTLYNIFYYLSYGVEVAPEHAEYCKMSNGEREFWDQGVKDIFNVRYFSQEPKNAAVKVFYRKRWYYIDDADRKSKTTFALLEQMFQIKLGPPTITPAISFSL
ncbi:MAG: hypothetical protein ACQEP8_05410 [Chlamydiota bacterium]